MAHASGRPETRWRRAAANCTGHGFRECRAAADGADPFQRRQGQRQQRAAGIPRRPGAWRWSSPKCCFTPFPDAREGELASALQRAGRAADLRRGRATNSGLTTLIRADAAVKAQTGSKAKNVLRRRRRGADRRDLSRRRPGGGARASSCATGSRARTASCDDAARRQDRTAGMGARRSGMRADLRDREPRRSGSRAASSPSSSNVRGLRAVARRAAVEAGGRAGRGRGRFLSAKASGAAEGRLTHERNRRSRAPTRSGFVALIGAPNAGKSTLVNQLVGAKVSIVTHKVQTTRAIVRGIATHDNAQIVFVDTPGIFKPRRRLDTAMVTTAWGGAKDADIVMLLIDAERGIKGDADAILERSQGRAPAEDPDPQQDRPGQARRPAGAGRRPPTSASPSSAPSWSRR